jgi:hypothetical protein
LRPQFGGQAGCGWRGIFCRKDCSHGIRRNRRVSSLRRCRELRCRHSRGLRHRPIDRLGSISKSLTIRIRWLALVAATGLAGCAHDPPAATIPATSTAPEPAPAAAPAPTPAGTPVPAPHPPVKIAPAVAPAPSAKLRSNGSQELRDYCKTASSVRCQRASEKSQGCSQLKSVAFGIHLQVIAFSRSMSLSEARDHAARNAHEVPPDLAQAVASQVTPGTLADSFANDIYRRCLTS